MTGNHKKYQLHFKSVHGRSSLNITCELHGCTREFASVVTATWYRIYFKQLVEGLSHIPSKGIIYRDIKLENIFLNKENTKLFIGDFGIQQPSSRPGVDLPSMLPLRYLETKDYNQAVDIWSLGILLYTNQILA
jgi:serine/threonine protein kinase